MISISFTPEDALDALIHDKIMGESGEAPPYSTHDPTAMRVVAVMRAREWCWEINVMPASVDVKLFRATEGLAHAIEASAPTFATAVCLAAKQSLEGKRWGWKVDAVAPGAPVR